MRFKSKKHLIQELLDGKKFKDSYGSFYYYDNNEALTSPFIQYNKAIGCNRMGTTFDSWYRDIWEEVTTEQIK